MLRLILKSTCIQNSIHGNISITRGVNTHKNIKIIVFTEMFREIFNLNVKVMRNDDV